MDFLARFDAELAARLNHRAASFRAVFAEVAARGSAGNVVETGCLRAAGNWTGDGQSTLLFVWLTEAFGGQVWSVDHSAASAEVARSLCGERAQVMVGDSVAFLAAFEAPIDLLYLDSADAPENTLMELCAAAHALRKGSIVMVDDTLVSGGRLDGQGVLVDQYMGRVGARLITQGYQRAWMI